MFIAWEIEPWYVPPCLVVWWEGVYFPWMLCTRKHRKISVLVPATFWNCFSLQSPPSPEYHLRASQKISYLKKGFFLPLCVMLIFFLSLKVSWILVLRRGAWQHSGVLQGVWEPGEVLLFFIKWKNECDSSANFAKLVFLLLVIHIQNSCYEELSLRAHCYSPLSALSSLFT